MRTHRTCLPDRQVLFSVVGLCLAVAAPAQAGIQADLSGDAVIDCQTTMDMPFMDVGSPGNADSAGLRAVDSSPRMCYHVFYGIGLVGPAGTPKGGGA